MWQLVAALLLLPTAASVANQSADHDTLLQAKLVGMGLPPGMEMPANQNSPVEQVTLAPIFYDPFMCSEHPQGQLPGLGDALGTDCLVVGGIGEKGEGFERPFRTNGRTNADWYGWHAEVHAPIDGIVKAVVANPVTNVPGNMGRPPASCIVFERSDGLDVVIAHIENPTVKVGDHVSVGEIVAIDGNNGMARAPHIHIGAWRGKQAFQIRWDSAAMGKVPSLAGN